ncbi:MAG: acetate--CoA ligase family protein [Nitrososphaerales archaeon]
MSGRSLPPDIVHKTDAGGVMTNLNSAEEIKQAHHTILSQIKKAKPDAKIDGVYVQKMQKDIDYELILGSKKDKDFGAVILFGLGGIGVELFKDFAIGLPPLNQVLAERIIEETRIYKALSQELRRKPPNQLEVY